MLNCRFWIRVLNRVILLLGYRFMISQVGCLEIVRLKVVIERYD